VTLSEITFVAIGAVFTWLGFAWSLPQARKALRQGYFDGDTIRYTSDNDPLMFYCYVAQYALFPLGGIFFLAVSVWFLV
jgi:hypothetical protein